MANHHNSKHVFSLFFHLDSPPLGGSCDLYWGPLCDQQPTSWVAPLLGLGWPLAAVTRTLSLSLQQARPGLFTWQRQIPRQIERKRGSLQGFLRPDGRTDIASLVLCFLSQCQSQGLHSRVGKAEKSHCKGPGYDEGKTVVVCAIYHKDGPVVPSMFL